MVIYDHFVLWKTKIITTLKNKDTFLIKKTKKRKKTNLLYIYFILIIIILAQLQFYLASLLLALHNRPPLPAFLLEVQLGKHKFNYPLVLMQMLILIGMNKRM